MKALVAAFNQEKALIGAFSVIVKTGRGTDGALHSTSYWAAVQRSASAAQLSPGNGHVMEVTASFFKNYSSFIVDCRYSDMYLLVYSLEQVDSGWY